MDKGIATETERLGQVIDQHRDEIEQQWLERVQRDVVKTPGLELTQLRDGIPDYLVALAKALKGSESAGEPMGEQGKTARASVRNNRAKPRELRLETAVPGVKGVEPPMVPIEFHGVRVQPLTMQT